MLKSLRRKLIGDLKANWGQFLAVWLVVTLGTALYGSMYPAATNLVDSVYNTYDLGRYMDFQVQIDSAGPELADRVRALPGVGDVEGRLIVEGGLQRDPAQKYLISLRLISIPDTGEAAVNRSTITGGRAPAAPGEILLLESFANYHGFEPGDVLRVSINGQMLDLRLAGLVFNPEYLVAGRGTSSVFPTPSSFGVAWMPYAELAALSGREGQINDLAVRVDGSKDGVRQELNAFFADQPGAVILSRLQTASGGVVDANVKGNFPVMYFFSGLFLAGAVVTTGILLARMVESERRRIGTMRAMGITRRELMQHYLMFGFLIGVTGGLVGSVAGYFNSFWFMNMWLDYVAGGTLPGFKNTPQIPFILLGFAITVIGATFSGAYPAWVQSGTAPGIALRPATPQTPNALSRIALKWLPLPVRQAVRNLLRAPGRLVGTAVGVMAGAMMLFSALALWDTLTINFDDYTNALKYDLQVNFDTMESADSLEAKVASIPGIEGAQAVLAGPVDVAVGDDDPFETIAIVVNETDPFFDLTIMDGARAFSSLDGVWIGSNLSRVLDLGVGDTITLRALGQSHEVKILGVASYEMGSPVFVPRGLFTQWTPIFPTNILLLRVQDGQAAAVRDAMVGLPGMVSVDVLDDTLRDIDHYLDYFGNNTILFGSFGVILMLALLYNTVNASLRERRDELAVLRALGTSPREIAVMVTLELLVMVIIGLVVGIPVGRVSGFWMNKAYMLDYFGQVNTVLPLSYVLGVIAMLLVVLLAEIPGLRAVQKVDLGQVSKSQSI